MDSSQLYIKTVNYFQLSESGLPAETKIFVNFIADCRRRCGNNASKFVTAKNELLKEYSATVGIGFIKFERLEDSIRFRLTYE